MNEKFGNYICSLRNRDGMTQRQLADALGVTFTYISKIENGKLDVLPSEDLICSMARVFEVDERTLLLAAGKIDCKKLQAAALESGEICVLLFAIQEGRISPEKARQVLLTSPAVRY